MNMQIELFPYELKLIHSFELSYGKRSHTASFIVKIFDGEFEGIGEIILPPYMQYSTNEVVQYVDLIRSQQVLNRRTLHECLLALKKSKKKCLPAMAGLDIALHDLFSQKMGQPIFELYGLNYRSTETLPSTSFTIGIETNVEVLKQKMEEAQQYDILKLKMGSEHDNFLLDIVLPLWDKTIVIDANQGWKNLDELK